jgi:hypothetical protein
VLVSETLSHAVRLELYPKARIELFVTVLENDGGGIKKHHPVRKNNPFSLSSSPVFSIGGRYFVLLGCTCRGRH